MSFYSRYYSNISEATVKNSILGAYFRYQRIQQNISLNDAAKSMQMNKGFLSDLERGNRHFPDGTIRQFNEFYLTNFNEDNQIYQESYTLLCDILLAHFQMNHSLVKELVNKFLDIPDEQIQSYGFFTYKTIELFYHIFFTHQDNKIHDLITLLKQNLDVFTPEEKAIFFQFCGEYYIQDSLTLFQAEECFMQSNSFCSQSSVIYAMNVHQLLIIFEKTNRSTLALLYFSRVKDELKYSLSYRRQLLVDMYQAKCLIQLGLQENAQEKINILLFSDNFKMLENEAELIYSIKCDLAFSYVLSSDYDKSIQISKEITKDYPEHKKDVWMLPYSLMKMNEHDLCNQSIEENLQNTNPDEKEFYLFMQMMNVTNLSLAYQHLKNYYLYALRTNKFEILSFLLDNMLSCIDTTNTEYVKVLLDIRLYSRQQLTIETTKLKEEN